jgi:hypothetical protein
MDSRASVVGNDGFEGDALKVLVVGRKNLKKGRAMVNLRRGRAALLWWNYSVWGLNFNEMAKFRMHLKSRKYYRREGGYL